MTEKKKIIAAGHICLDVTPVFPEGKQKNLKEVLTPGKLLHMNGVDIHTGGSAANTGLGFAKLGADVRILGKVGDDDFGRIVQNALRESGVSKPLIVDKNSSTSYSVVLAIPGVDRIFLHDPGANDTYSAADISDADLEGADLFHFGYPPLMKKMYEDEGAELEKLLSHVKGLGIPVSLDMAAVDPDSPAGKADWEKILGRCLPWTDIFLPSFEEILFMLDRPKYHRLLEKAAGGDVTEILDPKTDVAPLAEKLLSMGAKIVVIKCGSAGLYLAAGDRSALTDLEKQTGLNASLWARFEGFERSFKPARICSGTGAGDTCIAAFLTALLTKENPQMCLALAAAQGASCVEGYDALSGLRTLPQLKEKIAAGWKKNGSLPGGDKIPF